VKRVFITPRGVANAAKRATPRGFTLASPRLSTYSSTLRPCVFVSFPIGNPRPRAKIGETPYCTGSVHSVCCEQLATHSAIAALKQLDETLEVNPMKITNDNRAKLAQRLRNMRKCGALALCSVSTLKALSRVEDRAVSRLVQSITENARTDDETRDTEETEGEFSRLACADETAPVGHFSSDYSLTNAERVALQSARPNARSVVFRETARAEKVAQTAVFLADFVPAMPRDPELEKQAEIDAQAEIAEIARWDGICALAQGFETDDLTVPALEFAPMVSRLAPSNASANGATNQSETEFDRLLASVRTQGKARKVTFHA